MSQRLFVWKCGEEMSCVFEFEWWSELRWNGGEGRKVRHSTNLTHDVRQC